MNSIALACENRIQIKKDKKVKRRKAFLVMKFTVLFLLTACLQATAGNAQRITVSVKNVPLEQVMRSIEGQTGYHFLYTNEMLQYAKKVSLDAHDDAVENVLQKAFQGQPLTYRIFEKTIIIKEKNEPAVLQDVSPVSAVAPPVDVRGTVTDDDGQPLEGVTVLVRNSTAGTETDKNGKFSISIADIQGKELEFRHIGYKTITVKLNGPGPYNIKLQKEVTAIDDVVVIGYQTQRRRDVTGSISSVSSRDIKDIPINSTMEALTGRLAGVQITTTDGQPGTDAQIKVRGGISITQDNSPLYIIDGVQVENGLNYLSPQDIESVDVLKDASSTAIYGARGANGVVIITTKSGKDSRTTVNFNSFVGIRKLANELPVLSPYDFVRFQYERTRGAVKDSTSFADSYGVTIADLEKFKSVPGIDWQKEVFGRNAFMQTHNISISGGNKSTRFNLSGTLNDEDGIMITSGYNRRLVSFKLDHTANDKLKVGFTTRYNNQKISGAGTNTDGGYEYAKLRQTVKYRPLIINSNLGVDDFDAEYYDESNASNGLSIVNPIVLSNMSYRRNITNAFNVGGYLNYSFNKWLSFKTTVGADLNFQTRNFFDDTLTNNSKNNAGGTPITRVINTQVRTFNNSNVFTFSNARINSGFSRKNKINVLFGQESYTMTSKRNDMQVAYFSKGITPEKALGQQNLGTPLPLNPVTLEVSSAIYSLFSRIDYTYDNKYIASFSIRGDKSSKFAPGERLGYFPAGSFAWRISQEDFMKNVSFVSDMKLRLSYGIAGNNRINDYLYLTTMSGYASNGTPISYGLNDGNIPGLASNYLANPFLKWEKIVSRNIGLDLGLFNNRLLLTVDAYMNDGKDLLVSAPIPSTSGYATQLQNIGTTRNSGVEFQLSGNIIDKKDFTWNASLNMSFNRNTIHRLAGGQVSYFQASGWGFSGALPDFLVKIGEPVGLIYGFQSDGFYTLDDFNYDAGTGVYTVKDGKVKSSFFGIPQPGWIKIKDLNGDGVVDADNDRTVLGNAQPKFFGGFNQQVRYKNFDLSVFMNFSYGNKVLNASKIDLSNAYNVSTNMLALMQGYWRTTDANGKVLQQVVSAGGNQYVIGAPPEEIAAANPNPQIWQPLRGGNASIAVTSWAVEDGSFLRINNITLGYTLPASLLNRIKVKQLRVYATVNNLAVLTGYSGADPEVNTQRSSPLTPGVDYSAYPRSHAYLVGINLSL